MVLSQTVSLGGGLVVSSNGFKLSTSTARLLVLPSTRGSPLQYYAWQGRRNVGNFLRLDLAMVGDTVILSV